MVEYKVFSLLPGFETNTYLVWDTDSKETIIIDPSMPSEKLSTFIAEKKLYILYIINTHGHADHIGGNSFFSKKYQAPICIHADDKHMLIDSKQNLSIYMDVDLSSPEAGIILADNQIIEVGKSKLIVLHTPGHTKGSICILIDHLIFTGDTLFYRDIGRTDLPGGNENALKTSIQK